MFEMNKMLFCAAKVRLNERNAKEKVDFLQKIWQNGKDGVPLLPETNTQQSMQATPSGTHGIVASFCTHGNDELRRSQ
ncbi:MAG: hypothetical protein E7105_01305 [Prevotella sp.]|nr:hypothetical protein [Prevotella sp.]